LPRSDGEAGTVVGPVAQQVLLDSEGQFSIALWATDEGSLGLTYTVTLQWFDATTGQLRETGLGFMALAYSASPQSLNSLLVQTVPEPVATDVLAQAAAYAAAAAAAVPASAASAASAAASAAAAALYDGPTLDNMPALLADTTLTLTPGQPGTVTVGTIVRTKAEQFAFTVAAAASGTTVATAAGLNLSIIPMWVGADGGILNTAFWGGNDGVVDDADRLQACINMAANDPRIREIYIPGAVYSSKDIYCIYDATNNPGFPSGNLAAGRSRIRGSIQMNRRDWANAEYVGSYIRFAPGKRLILSKQNTVEADFATGQRGHITHLENLSIIGAHDTLIDHPYAETYNVIRNIFVGNSAPAAGIPTVRIAQSYSSSFENILVCGDTDLPTSAPVGGWVGTGIAFEPGPYPGGANTYKNITAAYFDECIVFGRDYDAGQTLFTKSITGDVAENIQGQYANIGIHVKHGVRSFLISASWGEACEEAPILIDNSAEGINVFASVLRMATGVAGLRGLIKVGNETGTPTIDAAVNVKIEKCNLFCTNALAGVWVSDAAKDVVVDGNDFWNGGGAAVGIQGGVGGEVTLRNNNYFMHGASSIMPPGRRFCVVGGTVASPTYTDRSEYALELDYKGPELSANLDCSTWRRPPTYVSFNTIGGTRTLTLPALSGASSRLARVTVSKLFAANSVVIDAQTGGTIKGAQTLSLTAAYSAVSLIHAGTGSGRWDVTGAAI
jgi:hypothetical protein